MLFQANLLPPSAASCTPGCMQSACTHRRHKTAIELFNFLCPPTMFVRHVCGTAVLFFVIIIIITICNIFSLFLCSCFPSALDHGQCFSQSSASLSSALPESAFCLVHTAVLLLHGATSEWPIPDIVG